MSDDTNKPQGSAEATLALLNSAAFQALPKGETQEIKERIDQLRNDWHDQLDCHKQG